ncbi:MAG: hypothetical protein HY331_16220 [Chloroflexi bacterium]|nr:hypothetical protein [Chloroflexota bacterium]
MRVGLLLVAAVLVGGAVVIRVWLAATGSYSQGDLSLPLRAVSGVSLVVGFVLAGAVVAWPVRKPGGPARQNAGTSETITG